MSHNASHYFYVSPAGKPEWTRDLHKQDLPFFLGFDPFPKNPEKINNKTYFEHLNLSFAKGFRLTTTYPGLLIGSSYSHPAISEGEDSDYQLGFFFDHTIGVPIIPGSTVKGVLKSVFPKIEPNKRKEKLDYINSLIKDESKIKDEIVTYNNWEEIFFENGNVFLHAFPINREKDAESKKEFGVEEKEFNKKKSDLQTKIETANNEDKKKLQKELEKLEDVFKKGPKEKYDISQRIIVEDAVTLHPDDMFKEPIPLKFIKVPAEVTFKFQFKINDYIKDGIVISADAILEVFKKILLEFGICAKRNVGYGHFKESKHFLKRGNK